MPAELSILHRYRCEYEDCETYFHWRVDMSKHYEQHHPDCHFNDSGEEDVGSTVFAGRRGTAQRKPPKPIPQEKIVKCTYVDCDQYFDDERGMIAHKVAWTQIGKHDFCPKCPRRDEDGNIMRDQDDKQIKGVDCLNWKEFVWHKVESDKHISCPECGMDFKSAGGMEMHVKQTHRTAQDLKCFICEKLFVNGAEFIRHIECNQCRNKADKSRTISKADLQDQLILKTLRKTILQSNNTNFSFSTSGMRTTSNTPSRTSKTQSVTRESLSSTKQSTVGRGVYSSNRIANGGLGSGNLRNGSTTKTQPQQSTVRPDLTPLLDNLSMISGRFDRQPGTFSNSNLGVKGVGTNRGDNPFARNEDARSDTTFRTSNEPRNAWSGASASARLFPGGPTSQQSSSGFEAGKQKLDATYNLRQKKGQSGLEAPTNGGTTIHGDASVLANDTNLLHQTLPEAAESCFDTAVQIYRCRFEECSQTADVPSGLLLHWRQAHVPEHRCPGCSRRFNSAAALMAHFESPSLNCTVRHTDKFNEYVHERSGGFLSVKREKTYRDSAWGDSDSTGATETQSSADRTADCISALRGKELRFEVTKPAGLESGRARSSKASEAVGQSKSQW